MKPNPEQDADRAAFEKWYRKEFSHVWHSQIGPEDTNHYEAQLMCWQAAKADSRAMQDAFEQVCAKANHVAMLHMCEQEGISSGMPTPQEWMEAVDALHEALAIAAPFRKTGV